jgi:tRNA (adenine37-N6)-methyltransferase
MDPVTYTPIGIVHTPFTSPVGMPVQTVAATGVAGTIELDLEWEAGLKDLASFSHLILLTHLHLVSESALEVVPFLDDRPHGVFATRSPRRPNPIGLSIVRLISISGCTLIVEDVDLVDGTPVLDIKPFVPAFDHRETERIGWFADGLNRLQSVRAYES